MKTLIIAADAKCAQQAVILAEREENPLIVATTAKAARALKDAMADCRRNIDCKTLEDYHIPKSIWKFLINYSQYLLDTHIDTKHIDETTFRRRRNRVDHAAAAAAGAWIR